MDANAYCDNKMILFAISVNDVTFSFNYITKTGEKGPTFVIADHIQLIKTNRLTNKQNQKESGMNIRKA